MQFMKSWFGRAAWAALVAALLTGVLSGTALAVTPEQYRGALEDNVESYSGSKTWQSVAGKLCADAQVRDGEGTFAITDGRSGDSLTTDAVNVTISGDVKDGAIVRLSVRMVPVNGISREFEYQAFSLGEIAFESLLGGGARDTDMCGYLFLYDVYPYAMWAPDSEFGDNSRSITTALCGVNYAINARAIKDDSAVELAVDVLGAAGGDDTAAALDNLYANYAFESICSLVYELDVCKATCAKLLKQGDSGDPPTELMGDMRSCATEYFALGAEGYSKLGALTGLLGPNFKSMLDAISSLESEISAEQIAVLEEAVDGMRAALRTMY